MLHTERGPDSCPRQLTRLTDGRKFWRPAWIRRESIPILFLEDGRWSCRFINRSIYRCWLTAVHCCPQGVLADPVGRHRWTMEKPDLENCRGYPIITDISDHNRTSIAAHSSSGKYCRLSPLINKLLSSIIDKCNLLSCMWDVQYYFILYIYCKEICFSNFVLFFLTF